MLEMIIRNVRLLLTFLSNLVIVICIDSQICFKLYRYDRNNDITALMKL